MNLKKQYQRLFEGRNNDYFDKLNKSNLNEAPELAPGQVPLDFEYYSDQLNDILKSIDEFHQEIGTQVEMKAEETGNWEYDTLEKQLSRYINVTQKGLENLQKYLERQKGKGL
jgi:hypothetical protein